MVSNLPVFLAKILEIFMIYYVVPVFILFLSIAANRFSIKTINNLIMAILIIYLGLRTEVSVDFYNYKLQLDWWSGNQLYNYFSLPFDHFSPILPVLQFIASGLNGDVYLVNLLAASILCIGIRFCSHDERVVSLCLIWASSYFSIAIAMGVMRQSLAIAFLLLMIRVYHDGRRNWAIISFCFAILSHWSALIFSPFLFAFFLNTLRYRILITAVVLISVLVVGSGSPHIYSVMNYYERYGMTSSAIIAKQMVYFAPVLVVLLNNLIQGSRTFQDWPIGSFLYYLLGLHLILFVTVLKFPESTVLERISVYLSLSPFIALSCMKIAQHTGVVLFQKFVIFCVGFVPAVGWLMYANHSLYWRPYGNVVFQLLDDLL